MFKLLVLTLCLALANAANPRIGFGSLQKHNSGDRPRVIGGTNAKVGEFPYQVSLQLVGLFGNGAHYCGGSILTKNTILTAGHCVTEVDIGPNQHVEVKAGITNTAMPETTLQSRRVSRTIVHPDFTGDVAPNDLAIHILAQSLDLNDYVKPISLPVPDSLPSTTDLLVLSGWGSTSTGIFPSYPTHLQRVDLPYVPYEECAAAIADDDTPLDNTMICTGPLTGGYGACSGDSGGPLVGANMTLVGVVSWGFVPCGSNGAPSVFTRVSNFVDWINANTVA